MSAPARSSSSPTAREGLRPDGFWFMEMNTRLQVEHPVTEAITGLDLVEMAVPRRRRRDAAARRRTMCAIDGHAVEARLYAEDPEQRLPAVDRQALALAVPGRARASAIDTGVEEGDAVTPFYDPMIAKVIAHGATRDEALDRLAAALGATRRRRPADQSRLPARARGAPEFRAGRFDTGFIDAQSRRRSARSSSPSTRRRRALGALMLIDDEWETLEARRSSLAPAEGLHSPWSERDGFELGPPRSHGLSVVVEGHRHDMSVTWAADGPRGRIRKRRLALQPGAFRRQPPRLRRAPTAD